MNSLIDLLRQNKLKSPTQRGFSPESLSAKLSEASPKYEQDKKIFESAIIIDKILSNIRERLNTLVVEDYTNGEIIYTLVYLVNSGMIESEDILKLDKFDFNDLFFLSRQVEGIIDALRYPLSSYLTSDSYKDIDSEKISQDLADNTRLKLFSDILKLGLMYHTIDLLWQECLWADWVLIEYPDYIINEKLNKSIDLQTAIGTRRREALLMEYNIRVEGFLKSREFFVLSVLLNKPYVSKISVNNKSEITLEIKKIGLNWIYPDHTSYFLMSYFLLLENMGAEFLSAKMGIFKGLSINDLMNFWFFISPLGNILNKLTNDENTPKNKAISYNIDKKYLYQTIRSTLGFTKEQAECVVDLFTYSKMGEGDLWLRPFIPVSDNKLVLVNEAIKTANLVRSVEYWVEKSKRADTNSKGKIYETTIRNDLIMLNTINNVNIVDKSITIKSKGQTEEIDLIICFPDTIIIGEVKSTFFSSTPVEKYRYFNILHSASIQAKRKAQFVYNNLSLLDKLIGTDYSSKAIKVHPLVVTNQQLGGGYISKEVPIVDWYLIEQYFVSGNISIFVDLSISKETSKYKLKFYESSAEAEKNLPAYLQSPPTIDKYKFLAQEVATQMYLSDYEINKYLILTDTDINLVDFGDNISDSQEKWLAHLKLEYPNYYLSREDNLSS